MRKGERVFLTEDYINAIYWEDLGNGFSLIARPNFQSLNVVATEQIETSEEDAYKQEEITYCMENLVHKQMSVEEFLEEVSVNQESVKKLMLEILKGDDIVEPFGFNDVCNATETLTSSEKNIELLQLYLGLVKLVQNTYFGDIISIVRIEDVKEKKITYIIMNKDIENNIYTDDFYVGCME